MLFEEGYVYHIKDEFFEKVKDDKLMQNKENGNFRPTYFCVRDQNTSLLWVVPMSSRIEKYQRIYDKQVEKYGKCITIVLGHYDGKKSAFLLQNMFPITEYYLDHIHTKNGNPVPVNTVIQKVVHHNMQQIRQILGRNHKIVFPDVGRIERIMLEDLSSEKSMSDVQKEHTPFDDLLIEIKSKAAKKVQRKDQELER